MKRLLFTLLFAVFVAHAFDSVEDLDSIDESPLTLSDFFETHVDTLDLKKKPKKCKSNADCKDPQVCRKLKIFSKVIKVCGPKPKPPTQPCNPAGGPPCTSRCRCSLGKGPCTGHGTCKPGLRCRGTPGRPGPRFCRRPAMPETDEDLVAGLLFKSDCKDDDDCTAPKKCKELQLGPKKVKRCVSPPLTPPKKCNSDADCTPKVCKEVGLGPKKMKICVAKSPQPSPHKCTKHEDCPKPKICKELSIMGNKIRTCVNPPKPAPKKCNSNADCDPPKTTCRDVSKGPLKLKLCLPTPSKPVTPKKCSSDKDCTKPRVCKEISFMGKKVKACVIKPVGPKKCKTNADCPKPKVCKKVRFGPRRRKVCVSPPPACPPSTGPRTKPCSRRCRCGLNQGPCTSSRSCKGGLTCMMKKCVPRQTTMAPLFDELASGEDSFVDSSSDDAMDLKKKKPKKCKKSGDCKKPFVCRLVKFGGKKRRLCLPPVNFNPKAMCPPMKGPRNGKPCTPMCKCGPGQGPCVSTAMCAGGLKCVEKVCKKPVPPMTKPAPPKGDDSSDLAQDAGLLARCDRDSDCSGNHKCRKIPLMGRRCVGFPGRLLGDDVNVVDEFEV